MTYLWLSLIFLAGAVLVLVAALVKARALCRALITRWWLPVTAAGIVVMVLTAVFDNVMIRSGLMAYASTKTSGLVIGVAPIEDFAYPAAGLILLPSLWFLFRRRGTHDQ
ncbi:lycopene cyclase domain-containing protein [Rathayibacter soli]|uniref:lycopene cyclase domain-containing protein n=1 Tax=Rathayibacter soli TaxID=3144168 RepID=UPI0027E59712|nr:lycopene cyclase domain-containing protein [Glaciibacter superstes]